MRQDVMRLSTPHTPTIAFRPNIDIKHLNVQDWPKYKSASAVLGHAFETYMSRMFNGRKFWGKVPLPTEPDIIVPTIWDEKIKYIYMECKCGNGDALLKILQSSKQSADGPIYYAIGFHTLAEAQKKVNKSGSEGILWIFPFKSIWILPADAVKKWLISGPRDAKLMKHYSNGEHYISMYEKDAREIFDSLKDILPTTEVWNIHAANIFLKR